MAFGKRSRKEEEAFLETFKTAQEDKFDPGKNIPLERIRATRLMLAGVVFLILMLLFDIGFRKYRYTETTEETIFYVLFLMSAVGALQIPIGLYYLIKSLWRK